MALSLYGGNYPYRREIFMSAGAHPAEGTVDLDRLQMVLLDMLSEIDGICRRHGIAYSMIGGTLLGAVRHGGFIPWDDDVDITMSRMEYGRFKALCATELNHEKFFLQDHDSDPHYRWGYAKLRRIDSEFIRVNQEHLKMRTGIFLDIFLYDNVPDFYPFRALHALYCFVLRKILYAETGVVAGKNFFIRAVYRTLKIIPHQFVFMCLEIPAGVLNRRKTRYVRSLTFPLPRRGTLGFPADLFRETVDMKFDGRTFKGLREYDAYLRFKYGDYMELPPPEERRWHPAAVIRFPDVG